MTHFGIDALGNLSNTYGTGKTNASKSSDRIDINFRSSEGVQANPWGTSFTTNPIEARVAERVSAGVDAIDNMSSNAAYEAEIDNFYSSYIENVPSGVVASTAFNVVNSGVWDLFNPDNLG